MNHAELSNEVSVTKNVIRQMLPGYGFVLFVFDLKNPQYAHYTSNIKRETMIKCLESALDGFKNKTDISHIDRTLQ